MEVSSDNEFCIIFFFAIILILLALLVMAVRAFRVKKKAIVTMDAELLILKQQKKSVLSVHMKYFETVNIRLKAMLENIDYDKCDTRGLVDDVISQSFPDYQTKVTKVFPFLDNIDVTCLFCWFAELSLADIGRLMHQSKSFANMRIERIRVKFQERVGQKPTREKMIEMLSDIL